MTDDELALLRNINANQDDDLPRLVYADWLDEHDRPIRAEFIRVQCELAQVETAREAMKPNITKENLHVYIQLKRRIRDLKKRYKQIMGIENQVLWLSHTIMMSRYVVSRGFVSQVEILLDSLMSGSLTWPEFDDFVVKPSIKGDIRIANLVNSPLEATSKQSYFSHLGFLSLWRNSLYRPSRTRVLWGMMNRWLGNTETANLNTNESFLSDKFANQFLKYNFPRLKELSTIINLEEAEFRILCEKLQAPRLGSLVDTIHKAQ